jgi:hypothetical protein
MPVNYEWLAEEVDEHGDIYEVHHFDSYAEAKAFVSKEYKVHVGLVRDVWNDAEGLIDRTWAYIQGGKLPEQFSDAFGGGFGDEFEPAHNGPKVPQKYHKEVEKGA